MTKTLERLNVKVTGPINQAIIFAHGYGCDQNMWRLVSPAFEDEYQVVLFDFPGAGKSKTEYYDPQRYATLDGYAQDVLEVCRALRLEQAIFVGHSVSAMIGMLAAIKEPERFEKLIMIGPSPCYINDSNYTGGFEREEINDLLDLLKADQVKWAKYLAPVIMANPTQPELSKELSDSICRLHPEIAHQFAQTTFLSDNRTNLAQLETSTLVIQSSDDIIASEEVGRYVHNNLKNSEYVKLQATGYCPHLSAPEEIIAAIKCFLSSTETSVVAQAELSYQMEN